MKKLLPPSRVLADESTAIRESATVGESPRHWRLAVIQESPLVEEPVAKEVLPTPAGDDTHNVDKTPAMKRDSAAEKAPVFHESPATEVVSVEKIQAAEPKAGEPKPESRGEAPMAEEADIYSPCSPAIGKATAVEDAKEDPSTGNVLLAAGAALSKAALPW